MSSNWNIAFWEYEFLAPNWLWLLLLVPFLVYFIFKLERKRGGEVKYTGQIENQKALGTNWVVRFREGILLVYGLIAVLMICALAKPFHWALNDESDKDYKNGIDIVIAMDVSGSMLADDFIPNRLETAKKVAKEFVDGRKADRIGLVAYAGEAYTACPPTLDHDVVKQQIDALTTDRIFPGTSIGVGLGTAVTRLRKDSIGSKVIILLTDGVDDGTGLPPLTAADLAKNQGIRVYTIGVGSTEEAGTPSNSVFGPYFQQGVSQIDEDVLRKIAQITGGKYFRAKDEESLKKIYKEINKLEKKKIEHTNFQPELPPNPQGFLNWAILLLVLTWSSKFLLFKTNE